VIHHQKNRAEQIISMPYKSSLMATIRFEKKQIREQMLKIRSKITKDIKRGWDEQINQNLKDILLPQHRSVHVFLPMAEEVNIYPFIQFCMDSNRIVVCPKSLRRGKMENRVLHSLDQLEDGIFGTRHPAEKEIFQGNYDLIIVPGLAFDRLGNRIGYGAGYYDKFLAQCPNAQKVGVAYKFQWMESIPFTSQDIKIDQMVYASDEDESQHIEF